jgi:hypothetical protein
MKYAGLTDDPKICKQEHGNPYDWTQQAFDTEIEARLWEKEMLSKRGYKGLTGNAGWRYGYTYTIATTTVE